MEKNNKKIMNAWCSYDIANSVYNLIITTVLFPLYYGIVTKNAFEDGIIPFLGFSFKNTVLYDYTIAFSYLIVVLISPFLSGIADFGGRKHKYMQFFTFLGGSACFSLYWFDGSNISFGIILISLASIGFSGSLLFYNSFLPQIATADRFNKLSSRGYSWGYAGSMLLLSANLFTIMNYEKLGFANELNAMKFSFLEVGLWWFGIAQISLWFLRDKPVEKKPIGILAKKGFEEIKKVFSQVKKIKLLKQFLFAFFFWSMGVQTIILVATHFGSTELGITGFKLIITIIVLQIVGIAGAIFFGWVSNRIGNRQSLKIMLLIWLSVCVGGYFIQTEIQFYFLAAGVGLVMGGIQSQSRSTYSMIIPASSNDTASFFSFYEITEKLAIVFGMFTFGVIEQITGSMRNSTIAMSLFFIVGFVILSVIKSDEL